MNPFTKLSPVQWFRWILGILTFLATLYLLLHWLLPAGRSKTKLTRSDIAILSSILATQPDSTSLKDSDPSDTTRRKTAATPSAPGSQTTGSSSTATDDRLTPLQRGRILGYIAATYELEKSDSLVVNNWIRLFDKRSDLIRSLSNFVFPVRSYFWLYDGSLYAEIIFWTWFGLIASLLYSVSEALRGGVKAFDRNEIWVHIAKFFYAPLCALVIFLGLSLAIGEKEVIERIEYSPNQVLVAFLMGFFSGRLIELLQGLKNLVFPGGAGTPEAEKATPAEKTASPEPTADDIRKAIEELGPGLRLQFPNVVGLALQTKQTAGQPTGQLSILFEVRQKVAGITTGKIPETLPFTTPDGRRVLIPTDVQEVGDIRFAAYTPGNPIHSNLPTAPGGSIRRQSLTNWGTLGLRLRGNQKDYVLSCYHVLCADLLQAGTTSVASQTNLPVVAPGTGGSPAPIGSVTDGRFDPESDFALVELTDAAAVGRFPAGQAQGFFDILFQPGDSLVGRTAVMIGAKSNRQEGKILAPYQEGDFILPGLTAKSMKGLIKTERLADEGDSGAAVFIEENNRKRVVGILIGFSNEASYVMPVSDFCSKHNLFIP